MAEPIELTMDVLKQRKFIMAGPNVIESEDFVLRSARALKAILQSYDVTFIFKASFDKANRTSSSSFRGVDIKEAKRIFQRLRSEVGVPIVTDIHESWQAAELAPYVDVLQIPAFLCRQTDLLEAAADTGRVIHVKKGQFTSSEAVHKSKEKILQRNKNSPVILCERGSFFGYQDLVVDARNLVWMRSDTNVVSMDITHCLQQPSQVQSDGSVRSGGLREFIPWMGRLAVAMEVHGIFMEVHERPDESLCDAPTQWPLDKFSWVLDFMGLPRIGNNTSSKPQALQPVATSMITTSVMSDSQCDLVSHASAVERIQSEMKYQANHLDSFGASLADLVDDVLRLRDVDGTIYCSAIGKSQAAAYHLSALLRSIGIQSYFIDSVNFLHGGLDVRGGNNMLILFSKSGVTEELLRVVREFKQKGSFVGVRCAPESPPVAPINLQPQLDALCDRVCVLPFEQEACRPHNPFLPTNSVMAQIIFGNLLFAMLLDSGEFQLDEYEPEGTISFVFESTRSSRL